MGPAVSETLFDRHAKDGTLSAKTATRQTPLCEASFAHTYSPTTWRFGVRLGGFYQARSTSRPMEA